MKKTTFEEYLKEQQRIIDTTFITVAGTKLLIKDIPDGTFTLEQYEKSRGGGACWDMIIPKLNQEALIHATKHYLANSRRENNITYDGALKNLIIPELMKRIEDKP